MKHEFNMHLAAFVLHSEDLSTASSTDIIWILHINCEFGGQSSIWIFL